MPQSQLLKDFTIIPHNVFWGSLDQKTSKKLYIAKQIKMQMIETLNVTLVTYLGGFILYWLHKIILVV